MITVYSKISATDADWLSENLMIGPEITRFTAAQIIDEMDLNPENLVLILLDRSESGDLDSAVHTIIYELKHKGTRKTASGDELLPDTVPGAEYLLLTKDGNSLVDVPFPPKQSCGLRWLFSKCFGAN